jgi:hypothetical protein
MKSPLSPAREEWTVQCSRLTSHQELVVVPVQARDDGKRDDHRDGFVQVPEVVEP